MKLRDQCEHGRWEEHAVFGPEVGPYSERKFQEQCPGGRVIEVDYEAATAKAEEQEPWAGGPSLGWDSYAKNILHAALGLEVDDD